MTAPMIYVLASPDGHRKVGYTSNLDQRAAQISPALPWPVELEMTYSHPRARKIEPIVHRILRDASTNGEWFSCSLGRIKQALPMATLVASKEKRKTKKSAPKDNIFQERLADLVTRYCKSEKITQADLAARLGYTRSGFRNFFTRAAYIPPILVVKIAAETGVDANWLFGIDIEAARLERTQ